MGPTTKAITVTGGVTFPQLVEVFYEQAKALVEGGADILLVETCQDTRNVKAGAGWRSNGCARELGRRIPTMVSGTIETHGHHARGADGRRVLRFGGARRPAFHRAELRHRAGVHDGPHPHHQ